MENQLSKERRAMEEELVRGREIANQLLEVCVHRSNTHHHEDVHMLPFIEDLVRKVLCSFTNTLLLLNTDNDVTNEVSMPLTVKDTPSFAKCPKPQHTDEVCKSFLQTEKRRGYYKKK